MWSIFFILVAIFGFHAESRKIRATRTQWVQYIPRSSRPVPQTQSNHYYNQMIPRIRNGRLIYSYVDPISDRFNMFGYGTDKYARLEAYKAYLARLRANGGQIQQRYTMPGYVTSGISVEQSGQSGNGIIGSGYQSWGSSASVAPTSQKWVHYGNGRNLKESLNQEEHSGNSEHNYDVDMPGSEQISYSADQNLPNAENREQEVDLDQSNIDQETADFRSNIANDERSDALYFGSGDTDLLNTEGQNHVAIGASLYGDENGISINNEENTNPLNVPAENDLLSPDDISVQNREKESSDDLKEMHVVPLRDEPEPENELLPLHDGDIPDPPIPTGLDINNTGIKAENDRLEDDLISEKPVDTFSIDRKRLDNTDARLQLLNDDQFEHGTVNNLIPSTPSMNLFGFYNNRNIVNQKPYIYPYFVQNGQQINRHRMPWSEHYKIRELHHRNDYYDTPSNYNMQLVQPVPKTKSEDLVNNLVSSICLNPNVNTAPQNIEKPAVDRLATLIKILQIFGIYQTSPNVYENIRRPQVVEYPSPFDYADNVLQTEIRPEPIRPLPIPYSLQTADTEPNELNIATEIIDDNPSNDENINNEEFITPALRTKNNNYDAENLEVDNLEPLQPTDVDEQNIMVDDTPEPEDQSLIKEELVRLLTDAITPELIKLYYKKCHNQINEKLVEGIITMIDSLQKEQCLVE